MRWPVAAAMLAAGAVGAAAEEEGWAPLSGEALRAALTARTLVERGTVWPLTGAERTWGFMADGRVLTDQPGRRAPEWLGWRVDGGRLCLAAPPVCAGVERHARGLDLRLTWEDGRVQVLRYVDL